MEAKRLNRAAIIRTYKKMLAITGLKQSELWVSSGSAMVLHGLRADAGDVDSGCHSDAFDKASTALDIVSTPFRANHAYIPEGTPNLIIDNMRMDILLELDITPNDLVVIDGVTCYNLKALLRQKRALNRDKDQADIATLVYHMRNRN